MLAQSAEVSAWAWRSCRLPRSGAVCHAWLGRPNLLAHVVLVHRGLTALARRTDWCDPACPRTSSCAATAVTPTRSMPRRETPPAKARRMSCWPNWDIAGRRCGPLTRRATPRHRDLPRADNRRGIPDDRVIELVVHADDLLVRSRTGHPSNAARGAGDRLPDPRRNPRRPDPRAFGRGAGAAVRRRSGRHRSAAHPRHAAERRRDRSADLAAARKRAGAASARP